MRIQTGDIVDKGRQGELKLAQDLEKEKKRNKKRPVPQRVVYTEEARQMRIDHLVEQTHVDLSTLRDMRLGSKNLRGNIESLIGAVEIPVGAAGPLFIHGANFDEEIFAPIATTEGALVSSINRGCVALNLAGGVTARVLKQRMVRAPVFNCGGLVECIKLKSWLQLRWGEIQKRVREFSNHAVLLELDFKIIAPCLHVRFVYETGDASGQNMTTLCTWNICQWIQSEYKKTSPEGICHFVIDGNLSTDKKASSLSAIAGRGREVIAEVFLPEAIIRRVLNTTSEAFHRYYCEAQATGILTGVHGLNVNVANVVAAIFVATGQDIASVHESSTAQLYFEKREGGMYASLLLPSLVIGSVGGGVSLAVQKQLLDLMGAYGPGKANRLGEVIASFALALELSTGAALTSGHFVEAHERLGRNKFNNWINKSHVNASFLNHFINLDEIGLGPIAEVRELAGIGEGESLASSLTSQISQRPSGLWGFELQFAESDKPHNIFLKVKSPDHEFLLALEILAGLKSPGLGELLRENREDSIFKHSHIRELKLAEFTDPELKSIMPRTYGVLKNESRQVYILAQEYLEKTELLGAVEKRHLWTRRYIETAIKDISRVHGKFLNKTEALAQCDWMMVMDQARVGRLQGPFYELAYQLYIDCMDWFSAADLKFHERHLNTLPQMWREIGQHSQTLIHNDFNPRNITFRNNQDSALGLVAYDWELATIHLPQRDIAELLSFTLGLSTTYEELMHFIDLHRRKVNEFSGEEIDSQQWIRGFELAFLDLILMRLPIYYIAQTVRQVPFLQPSYKVARHLLSLLQRGAV